MTVKNQSGKIKLTKFCENSYLTQQQFTFYSFIDDLNQFLTDYCSNKAAVTKFFNLFWIEITMLMIYSGERGSGR